MAFYYYLYIYYLDIPPSTCIHTNYVVNREMMYLIKYYKIYYKVFTDSRLIGETNRRRSNFPYQLSLTNRFILINCIRLFYVLKCNWLLLYK